MNIPEKIAPEDRIREFEDIRRCISKICGILTDTDGDTVKSEPVVCPDKTEITIHRIGTDFYAVITKDLQKRAVSIDDAVEYMMTSYLLTDCGLEVLTDAVMELGKPYVCMLSGKTILKIVPTKDGDAVVEFETV